MKFQLGKIAATIEVDKLSARQNDFAIFVAFCINRHKQGDWGDLPKVDKEDNDLALENDWQLMSAYNMPQWAWRPANQLWIITEADRSSTTLLFPHEY